MDSAELPWELPDAVWESMVGPFLSRPAVMERAAADVDHIVSLTGVAPTARVLDLCCGVGRHALELARRALSVRLRIAVCQRHTASLLSSERSDCHTSGCIVSQIGVLFAA